MHPREILSRIWSPSGASALGRRDTPPKGWTHQPRNTPPKGCTSQGTHHPRYAPAKGYTTQGIHYLRDTLLMGCTFQGIGTPTQGIQHQRDTPLKGNTTHGMHHPRDKLPRNTRQTPALDVDTGSEPGTGLCPPHMALTVSEAALGSPLATRPGWPCTAFTKGKGGGGVGHSPSETLQKEFPSTFVSCCPHKEQLHW